MNNDNKSGVIQQAAQRLAEAGLLDDQQRFLVVDVAKQQLHLCESREVITSYPISTAAKGAGCQMDSFQTPTGIHRIAEKIGAGEPDGMIFEGRIATGKCAEIERSAKSTGEDLITSRILWLEGLESGINQGAEVDTKARYIYIHGTNEEGLIGQPVSHGCVRMMNQAVIQLYDQVNVGYPVFMV